MPFVVGENLGPYRIVEQLGQGGMATVFKAYHAALDRYVAIKALHPAFTEDPNFLARFQREARLVAKLEHPNIVPIYDFAEHEGRPYLVMKYIEGETLKARLGGGPLSVDETVQIVTAVGAGLSYAHRQGILHRDVKPSNVILSKEGQIYLADFGLARIASAGESTLSSDMMLGTPQYISPEQALGKRDLDEGTDIYSFGVLLYEMVVGKVPYTADTPYAIIHDHIYSPLPLPHSVNPGVPEAVERVLLKALAKDRSDRFGSVAELVEAFKAALSTSTDMPVTVLAGARATETPATVVGAFPAEAAGDLPPAESDAAPRGWRGRRGFWRRKACIFPIAGVVLMCICLGGILVNGSLQRATQGSAGLQETPAIGTLAVQPLDRMAPGQPGEQPLPANDPAQALEAASQRVKDHPEDPQLHLDLAAAFFDLGRYADARQEFAQVRQLEGENSAFYRDAGQRFIAEQRWVPAAWLLLQAAQSNPSPAEIARGTELWREAIYKACVLPGFNELVTLEGIEAVDAPMAGVARARQLLYASDPVRSEAAIRLVLRDTPDFAEAQLAQAELLARSGADELATPILNRLGQNQDLPAWIREEAKRIYEQEIPK